MRASPLNNDVKSLIYFSNDFPHKLLEIQAMFDDWSDGTKIAFKQKLSNLIELLTQDVELSQDDLDFLTNLKQILQQEPSENIQSIIQKLNDYIEAKLYLLAKADVLARIQDIQLTQAQINKLGIETGAQIKLDLISAGTNGSIIEQLQKSGSTQVARNSELFNDFTSWYNTTFKEMYGFLFRYGTIIKGLDLALTQEESNLKNLLPQRKKLLFHMRFYQEKIRTLEDKLNFLRLEKVKNQQRLMQLNQNLAQLHDAIEVTQQKFSLDEHGTSVAEVSFGGSDEESNQKIKEFSTLIGQKLYITNKQKSAENVDKNLIAQICKLELDVLNTRNLLQSEADLFKSYLRSVKILDELYEKRLLITLKSGIIEKLAKEYQIFIDAPSTIVFNVSDLVNFAQKNLFIEQLLKKIDQPLLKHNMLKIHDLINFFSMGKVKYNQEFIADFKGITDLKSICNTLEPIKDSIMMESLQSYYAKVLEQMDLDPTILQDLRVNEHLRLIRFIQFINESQNITEINEALEQVNNCNSISEVKALLLAIQEKLLLLDQASLSKIKIPFLDQPIPNHQQLINRIGDYKEAIIKEFSQAEALAEKCIVLFQEIHGIENNEKDLIFRANHAFKLANEISHELVEFDQENNHGENVFWNTLNMLRSKIQSSTLESLIPSLILPEHFNDLKDLQNYLDKCIAKLAMPIQLLPIEQSEETSFDHIKTRLIKVGKKNITPKIYRKLINEGTFNFSWDQFNQRYMQRLQKINEELKNSDAIKLDEGRSRTEEPELAKLLIYKDWGWEISNDHESILRHRYDKSKIIKIKYDSGADDSPVLLQTSKKNLKDPNVMAIMLEMTRDLQRMSNQFNQPIKFSGLQEDKPTDRDTIQKIQNYIGYINQGIEQSINSEPGSSSKILGR